MKHAFSGTKKSDKKKLQEKSTSAKLDFSEIKELMLSGAESGADIELKRMEAYYELTTQKLLRNLLDRDEKEVLPDYHPILGFKYDIVESALDSSPGEAEEVLERLSELGILEKTFFDTILACPTCGSTSIRIHHRCPTCTSHHIVKAGLIEHIPCGSIDERAAHYRGQLHPTCPKCGSELVKGEYRDMGLWYICKDCKEKFEHPNIDLVCHTCNNEFTIRTSIIKEISKYHLNPDKENEIRQNVTSLESVNDILTNLGFDIELSASLVGDKSGIEHKFSLVGRRESLDGDCVIVLDHAVGDTEVNASSLILYLYKISEINYDLALFLAIPKLSDMAKKIAEGYNILIIEGIPENEEQLEILKKEIDYKIHSEINKDKEKMFEKLMMDREIYEWIVRRGKMIKISRDEKGRFRSIKDNKIEKE